MNTLETLGWTISDWLSAHQQNDGNRHLEKLVDAVNHANDCAWISRLSASDLKQQLEHLNARREHGESLPLFGVPFAVKDNIDVAGWMTTAACPAFAYTAAEDATVVARLKKAGAILIGKTNLDQFATGLVGTRSPYGAVSNSFKADYVSGGSSSGSASVTARGLVAFALGTDTAGSGRVPAGFNNLVGLKPTRGWFSIKGVVPACRSIDCVSVFALTVVDALQVAQVLGEPQDLVDAYSRKNPNAAPTGMPERPRFAIPSKLEFFGDELMQAAFAQARSELEKMVDLVEIDFTPFTQLAELLYQGPWVAERTHAIGSLLIEHPEEMDSTVRTIVAKGTDYTALQYFDAEYQRQALARHIQQQLSEVDALVVPTSPTIRTLAEMQEEPILYNSQFGTYTNFTNLADLSALALPAPFRADELPAGITLIANAWHDFALADFGQRWQAHLALPMGATGKAFQTMTPAFKPVAPGAVRVAVVGAHLTGMPLNFQLTTRHASFVETTQTAPEYRLYALANTTPPKPGLARVTENGASIQVELWDVPLANFGAFVAEIPEPLGIGNLLLEDGRSVKGFICEPLALGNAKDITHFGGWRAYLS
ncbi:allophanate hydrolase [Nitrincola tibetensis]|uniref:Allophanate hydrolase n=1 Tax=Nitrincola tibetensis TaxID=2219697 RepID=A0A364NRH0_9GAMM|nr:allophanate hydrolase [Nitrincola tibetensis]RAU19644.1 allophanate hydrolase [Nitrincola tibetensis]